MLSQEALAERAGLSARAISDLERGVKTRPYLATVQTLALALGLSDPERAELIAAARPHHGVTRPPLPSEPTLGDYGSLPPAILSSLVGRDEEVASLAKLLQQDDVRLVTLTGPGGVGKTRLALAIAQQLLQDYPNAVRFADLTSIREPELVPMTIAQSLGVRESSGKSLVGQIRHALHERRTILIIDNFEHVIDAAPVIAQLLVHLVGLKVIATSRMALCLTGEVEVPVNPLVLPSEDVQRVDEALCSPSVSLFVKRARAVSPGFELSDENALAVAEICRQLDGLPLAIELAAVRIKLLSPEQLRERLSHSFTVLGRGPRDVPDRHQTLRNTVKWSYELLTEPEQNFFRRLAVFSGGWTLDAAEAICGQDESPDEFDLLASLVDQSLVQRAGDEPRFQMMETVHAFALEQLARSGEEQVYGDRHCSYFLEMAERADRIPHTPEKDAAGRKLLVELPNLRAALEWAADQSDAERLMRLVIALWWFWDWEGPGSLAEGSGWTDRAISATAEAPPSLLGRRAHLLALGAHARLGRGITSDVSNLLAKSLALARETQDPQATIQALLGQGQLAIEQGDLHGAESQLKEALAEARTAGEIGQSINLLNWLTWIYSLRGDWERAEANSVEYLEAARASGWKVPIAMAVETLGTCARERGDHVRAASLFAEALTLLHNGLDLSVLAVTLKSVGAVAAATERAEPAVRLFGASEMLRVRKGFSEPVIERERFDQAVAPARAALPAERFAAAWEAGQLLSVEEAISEALAVAEEVAAFAPPKQQTRAGLTPRELAVLRLVVEGHSDREIADALFVSRHTAANHVGNILSKLGVSSRAAAAAWAVRNGLA